MFSAGIRNPQRSVMICLAVTVIAWASIAWGVYEMHATGEETPGSGLKIGLALLPAILAPLPAVNFWRGIRVIASLRRGTNAIGRWTVTAAELAEFAASNKARNALGIEHHNEWHMPRDLPAAGIEVTFAPDRVFVGDTYFALSTTGLFRFTNVWMLAGTTLAIAFRTLLTLAKRFGARVTLGELRIPVSRLAAAEAARAVIYFEEMSAGKMIANPNFYRTRLWVGLIGAPTFLAIAALGFVLGPNDMSEGSMSISSLMVIIGLVAGITMLILALAAKLLGRVQSGRAAEAETDLAQVTAQWSDAGASAR